jgi:hypothetical protein
MAKRPRTETEIEAATRRMFEALVANNAGSLRGAIEDGANVNAKHRDHGYALERAYTLSTTPEILIALLEAGADVSLGKDSSVETLLSQNPFNTDRYKYADVMMVAGLKLTGADKDSITRLRIMHGFKTYSYVERVAAGKEAMPTVESLKENYGINFDLAKRNQNLAQLSGEELPVKKIAVPAKTPRKVKLKPNAKEFGE